MAVKFGPGGNSESFYAEGFKSTLQAPAWVRDRGLDAYEYQGGNGITASAKTLSAIGEAAAGQGISMSLHTLTIFPCLQNSRRSAPKVWTTLPPPPTHARRWARASWSYIPAAPRSSHERRRWPTPPTRWKRPASSSQTRVRTCGWGWKRWASRTSSARSMKCCACAGSRPRSSRRSSISAI